MIWIYILGNIMIMSVRTISNKKQTVSTQQLIPSG